MGENSILCLQYMVAEKITRRYITDLKAVAKIDAGLPGKLLWMLHLRTQAFLRTCSEVNGDTFDTSILDWDREITSIAQGLGGTSIGTVPPFLRHQHHGRGTAGTGGTAGEGCVNQRVLWAFRQGQGKRALDSIIQRNEWPPELEIGRICLHFHLIGRCKKGTRCAKASSHRALNARDARKFEDWATSAGTSAPVVPTGFPPGNDTRENDRRQGERGRWRDNVRSGGAQGQRPNGRG